MSLNVTLDDTALISATIEGGASLGLFRHHRVREPPADHDTSIRDPQQRVAQPAHCPLCQMALEGRRLLRKTVLQESTESSTIGDGKKTLGAKSVDKRL
jgi:hypothetical protein